MDGIKKARTAKKMTQDDLAKKLKVQQNAVSNWERGKRSPSAKMLKEIANILECSIESLY